MRIRSWLAPVLICSIALAASGCGEESQSAAPTTGGPDPAAMVPASVPIYAEAVVRPTGDLAQAVKDVSTKVAKEDNPGGKIIEAIEKASGDDGGTPVDFETDLAPWLGERVGLFANTLTGGSDFPGAIIIPSTDNDKAKAFLAKQKKANDVTRTYEGVEYNFDPDQGDETAAGLIGDNVVVGSEAGFKAVVDAKDAEKLSGKADFKSARDLVGKDGLGFVYIDPKAITTALTASGQVQESQANALTSLVGGTGIKAVGLGLQVQSDAVSLDIGTIGGKQQPGGDPGAAMAALPGDAVVALGVGDLGKAAQQLFDTIDSIGGAQGAQIDMALTQFSRQTGLDIESDLLSWMGDAAIFARGDSPANAGGAVIVTTTDPAKTKSSIAKIQQLLALANIKSTPISTPTVDAGFELTIPDFPLPIQIALKGDRFVIAVGAGTLADALEPPTKLGDSEAYKSALGLLRDGAKPAFFLDFPKVVGVLERYAGSQPGFSDAKPYLDAIGQIAAGSAKSGDSNVVQVAVGIR